MCEDSCLGDWFSLIIVKIIYLQCFLKLYVQLFSQRHSLIKLATLKGTKGEKISYCLACLISLVEQVNILFSCVAYSAPSCWFHVLLDVCFRINLLLCHACRRAIYSSESGRLSGVGVGTSSHLYLSLSDIKGLWKTGYSSCSLVDLPLLTPTFVMLYMYIYNCRIVLERPEYGYATYFFELVDSLSIDWQIKRLVTAMKLTSCSRISLIENRALTVLTL